MGLGSILEAMERKRKKEKKNTEKEKTGKQMRNDGHIKLYHERSSHRGQMCTHLVRMYHMPHPGKHC